MFPACGIFPTQDLTNVLAAQEQVIIPVIHIHVASPDAYDIYISDRAVSFTDGEGGYTCQPRLAGWDGIQQGMSAESDTAKFTLGNADRVFTKLVNAVRMDTAWLEFSLYIKADGTMLDLWAGEIYEWEEDEGPTISIMARDGLHDLTSPCPFATVSRTCWKPYNDSAFGCTGGDGLDLEHFPNALAGSCDKGWDSENGCLAHKNIAQYAGVYVVPQGVYIGGLPASVSLRNAVSPLTSVVNDTIVGQPLQQIWHDDEGNKLRSLPVECLIATGRDEDDYLLSATALGPLRQRRWPTLSH